MELSERNGPYYSQVHPESSGKTPVTIREQGIEENKAPPGLEKDWTVVAAEILGFPLSWTRGPPLRYTDPQPYPLRTSSNRVATERRVDSVLTRDGIKFKELKVQSADYLQDQSNSTWQRHSLGDTSTMTMKFSKLPLLAKRRFDARFGNTSWGPWVTWLWYFWMWVLGLTLVTLWMTWLLLTCCCQGRKRIRGDHYEPFYYRDDRYPRVASNPTGNRKPSQRIRYDQPVSGDRFSSYGLIRPRMLVRTNEDGEPFFVRDIPADAAYVFIAFSMAHFSLYDKKKQKELVRVGNKVTQNLGYQYFWVSASCMNLDENELKLPEEEGDKILEQDIYGISDVVRGASAVVIVLPDESTSHCPKLENLSVCKTETDPNGPAGRAVFPRLRKWSSRVWTLPEVLLGPNKPITISWKEGTAIQWYRLDKQHFPGYVWEDGETSMQMVRHYKNPALSRLEFVKIAMSCLTNRQETGIEWHYPGDLSYVLMGFLRIRPPINKHDSSLQAFARLSLPADNDRLMERFLCLQWKSRQSDWTTMEDAFKADLWSIEPYIQIAGVGENDTVIIEKALGARIELSKFQDISAIKLSAWRHFQGISAGLMVVPETADWMAKRFRKRKYKRVYPRLYCFEGFMSTDKIEEKLFGNAFGLLSWSPNTSTLSKHEAGTPVYEPRTELSGDKSKVFAGLHPPTCDTDGTDLEAQDESVPLMGHRIRDSIEGDDGRIKTYPIVGRQPWTNCTCGNTDCICPHLTDRTLEAMGRSAMGEDKIFTLIDTASMTVTLLTAAWPPQALIACGVEGGMERVLVCSYDWTTGVLYKECVLRCPGIVLENMHKLPGIRLGYRRTLESADIAPRQKRRR